MINPADHLSDMKQMYFAKQDGTQYRKVKVIYTEIQYAWCI